MKSGHKKMPKAAPGTWVERLMFQSKAFIALRGVAPQLLILFLAKRKRELLTGNKGQKRWEWTNLDSITMTYAELKERYGISQPRATRGIDDLLAKGFLEIRHQGGAYKKDKTIYALVEKWQWWSKGTIFSKREPDVHRGFQGGKRK